jgi:plastocyanin
LRKLIAVIAALALVAAVAVPALAASRKTVKLGDNFFSPKTLTVKKGTKLTFRWTGSAPHNVKGAGINIGTRTKGSKTVTVRKGGTIICTIHQPEMRMRLKVR